MTNNSIILPPLALGAGLVSGGFLFLGIGFAIVKQLVGVDIGFTPLAVRWPPSTTEVGAFFLGIEFAFVNPLDEPVALLMIPTPSKPLFSMLLMLYQTVRKR